MTTGSLSFPHLPPPFFFPLASDPAAASSTNPARTNASLAAALISANRLGPSFCPPYQRVTTTITFQRSISCIRCSRRPPAAVSPSSSQSYGKYKLIFSFLGNILVSWEAEGSFWFSRQQNVPKWREIHSDWHSPDTPSHRARGFATPSCLRYILLSAVIPWLGAPFCVSGVGQEPLLL